MTVAAERPREEVVKKVRGQLLRREESYTEAVTDEDFLEEEANTSPAGAAAKKVADVVMVMNPSYNRAAEDHCNNKIAAAAAAAAEDGAALDYFIGPALKRNIRAWCEATGLPTTITIRFKERVFRLHKFPLVSRSGYLKRLLKDTREVTLPRDCPGGPDIFELVANFCYGSTILMEPSNIAELRCVAEYLQMSEEYGRANLSERSDLYLTQVALQSWEDTLVVLLHCESLAPLAEQLHIVSRCIESLAFMACMEILGPADRKAAAAASRSGEIHQFWSSRDARDASRASHDWWVQDLVALPPTFFVRLVVAMRRQGMPENHIGQVITSFADRWIFGTAVDTVLVQKGRDKLWVLETQPKPNPCMLLEAVVRLLPLERNVAPIAFLFALLRCGLACGLTGDCRMQLETRIALQFEQAALKDLLLPGKKERDSGCVLKTELESMERIVKLFISRHRGFDAAAAGVSEAMRELVPGFSQCIQTLATAAKLWDEYLAEVAFDVGLAPGRFADLIDRVPGYARVVHDHVYKAIHAYLQAHPSMPQEERLVVCRTLNCQKLSQEACTHAVQNDLMPLRMIVQAMFMQQLQTRTALTSHLESAAGQYSFRSDPHGAGISPGGCHSGRHRCADYFSLSQDSFRSTSEDDPMPPSFLAKRDKNIYNLSAAGPPPPPKVDYQATESRLRSLEAELSRMRKVLSDTMVDQDPSLIHQRPSSSSSLNLGCTPSGAAGGRNGPMPPVQEGASGCMSQLKQANRTSGLLAKTLQKLRFGSFRRAKGGEKRAGPAAGGPTPPAAQVVDPAPAGAHPWWQGPHGSLEALAAADGCVSRVESMPRPVAGRPRPHHVRHNSLH